MNIYLWLAFACLGGGIKYIDDVFDEGIHNKKVAYPLAFFLVALWILLCILDPYVATILTAIFLSVLITGKLDTKLGILVAVVLLSSLWFYAKNVLLVPLIFLTIMGTIDEVGNNYVDKHKVNSIINFIFEHRCMMKFGIILLYIQSILPVTYLIAFFSFDIAYDLVGLWGKHKEQVQAIGEDIRIITKPKHVGIAIHAHE